MSTIGEATQNPDPSVGGSDVREHARAVKEDLKQMGRARSLSSRC